MKTIRLLMKAQSGQKWPHGSSRCIVLVNTHIVQLEADNDATNDEVGTADRVDILQAQGVTGKRRTKGR